MKRAFRISILIILLFAVVVIITAKEERSIDGNDVYGFPLIFLTEYGGLVASPESRLSSFNFLNLIIDLSAVTVLVIFVERAVAAIVEKIKSKSATR